MTYSNRLNALPRELLFTLVDTMSGPDCDKALLALTRTSKENYKLVADEHPRLKLHADLFSTDVSPQKLRAIYCERVNLLIDEKRPEILSLFIRRLKSISPDNSFVVNSPTDSVTPLVRAAKLGALGVVKCLAKHGAQLTKRDVLGHDAIWWSARAGYGDTVGTWIHSAIEVKKFEQETYPTLTECVRAGHVALTRELLANHDAPLDVEMLYAAIQGDPQSIIPMLLTHTSELRNVAEGTAIKAIVTLDVPLPTVLLLQGGIPKDGMVMAAAKAGKLDVLQHLLTLPGTSAQHLDSQGKTALHHAMDGVVHNYTLSYDTDDWSGYHMTRYENHTRISDAHAATVRHLLTQTWSQSSLDQALEGLKNQRAIGQGATDVAKAVAQLETSLRSRGARLPAERNPRSITPPTSKAKKLLGRINPLNNR